VQETADAARLARRAVELGGDNAVALQAGGFALAYVVGELEDGVTCIDHALMLDPNLAKAWHASGWVRCWLGDPELALKHSARAMRLSPFDPLIPTMQAATAFAHFLAGRCEEASWWSDRAVLSQPNFVPGLFISAASKALAGRLDEARKAMARARQLDPTRCISNLKERHPFRRPEDRARYEEGLRKAGLPE
jgi:tetratricopeptide (TPR) repeat protein